MPTKNRPKKANLKLSAEQFLQLLADNGGAITSSNEHDPETIERARDEGRFYVDSNGFGYVWDSYE